MSDHRAEFSKRLAAAMRAAGYEPRPGVLCTQFNIRFHGPSVTFQTASRWLRGQAIPKFDKLALLADWLNMDRGLLGFGENDSRSRAGKHIREDAASYEEHELVKAIRILPAAHRKLVRELVLALGAATPSKG